MRYLFLLALCLSVLCTSPLASSPDTNRISQSPIVQTAEKYLHVRERGYNRGKEIEFWQSRLGGRAGYPYCAYFVSAMLDESRAREPTTRTGRAQGFLSKKAINPAHVIKGYVKIESGYLVVWAKFKGRKNTGTGHVGIVKAQKTNTEFQTIEANTSSGERGSQDDGDGVYIRNRKININGSLRIVGFIPTKV